MIYHWQIDFEYWERYYNAPYTWLHPLVDRQVTAQPEDDTETEQARIRLNPADMLHNGD